MQRAEDSKPPGSCELPHDSEDDPRGIWIKTGDRLISKQDAAISHQGPRYCDALLLTTRERVSALVPLRGETNGAQRRFSAFLHLFRIQAGSHTPKGERGQRGGHHIREGRPAADEVELLEHDTDVAARKSQLSRSQGLKRTPIDLHRAGIGLGKPPAPTTPSTVDALTLNSQR
jgi:hypothetical protein